MRTYLLLLLISVCSINAFSQTYRDEFGFKTDNDSYLASGSDRYYTNGLFIYFNRALAVKDDNSSLANKILGFELGQKMYNAQAGIIPAAVYVDRPFAGYSYVASSLNFLYKDESNIKLSAQLGVIGPASGAQAIQEWVHQTLGQYKIAGWEFQIKNNAEVNLSMEYNRLLARATGIDVSLASYANLGNGFTGAGVGPLLRLGSFNQLFYSQTTQSTVTADKAIKPLHEHELFFYYKPQLNWVGYDATIEGGIGQDHNYFSTGQVVSVKEPFIFNQQLGAAYTTNRWVYEASVLFETKETKEMVHNGHQWGSIEILYHFN